MGEEPIVPVIESIKLEGNPLLKVDVLNVKEDVSLKSERLFYKNFNLFLAPYA
jgi:hypothetical protein